MSSSSKRGRDEDSEMDHSPPPNTSMAFTHPEARNILLPPPSKRQAVGVGFSAVNAPTAFNPILRAPPVTTTSYSSSQHQSKHPVELVKEELERYSSSESFAAGKLSHAICLLETVNARDPLVLTEKFTIPRRTCVYLLWIIQNLDEKTAGAVVAEEASCPKEIKHWFEGLCANSSFRSTENVKLILDVHEKFVEFVKVCRDAVQGRDLGHMMERLVERAVRIHARRSILVNAYGVMEIFMDLLVHSTDMEFHRDFVRYCWVMFLLWREFTPRDQVFDAENTICSVVFFASVQVPSSKRKTLKSISMRANRQYPDYDHDNDWTHNANLVYPLVSGIMSEKVQSFNNELVFRNETLFQNIIKSPYFDGRKKSTPIDGIIFESYEGLLGDGPKGSLSNLVEVLNQHYEQQHATDKLDFDYRLILPAFRVFATPRKRMQSTSSTASPMRSNRSLKTVFARASVFTTQMLTTPITARSTIKGIDGGTHHQYSAMNNSELKITLERVFGGNLSHPDEIDRRARVVFMNAPSCGVEAMNRLKEFIKSLKSIVPESEKAWDLVAAIYIRFLESFVPVCPQFDKKNVNRTQLLYDRQYHLCLLLCAYEVIRYSHEISMRSFDIVLRLFDINYVELCIVIDMLHKSQLWFSVSLLKRFFEIRERLLESEVWKSQRVYDLLNFFKSGQLPPTLHITELVKLYTVLIDPSNIFVSTVGSDAANDPFKGMQSFNSSFTKLLTSRALDMCDKLDLNAMVRHKVTALIEGILNIEYQVRLLRNRHADVLMLCALFSACKLTKVPISWIQLLPCYEKQPQATRNTTMLIYVDDGHDQIDIAKFYNAIFVPTVGNILKPGENLNTEPAGLEMFSPLRKRTEATQTAVRNPVPNNGRTNRVLGASTRTLFPLSKLSSHSTTM